MTDRPLKTRVRYVLLFPEDEADISLALRHEYPDIVFLMWMDRRAMPLRSKSSLAACTDPNINIWVPTGGWEAKQCGASGHVQRPRLEVVYQRGRWLRLRHPPDSIHEVPTPEEGRFASVFDPDDLEQRRFVRRVWAIIATHTSNRMDVHDPTTLRPTGTTTSLIWVGHHAIRWCAAHPRRVLTTSLRPSAEAVAAAEAALGDRPVPDTPDDGSAFPRPPSEPA